MRLLELITRKKSAPSVDELQVALGDDEASIEQANAELARLRAARGEALLAGTDAQVQKIDADISIQAIRIERVTAARARAQDLLAEAEAREEAAERQRAYRAAKASVADAQRALAEYEPACRALLGVLRQLYDAEALIHAANQKLPEGATPIPSPEFTARGSAKGVSLSRDLELPAVAAGEWLWQPSGTDFQFSPPGTHAAATAKEMREA
ncbi:hypothetical protein RDV64_19845 [Acuticoccus sp. MNP-M23]|uniref:hypothetical protein n=1 Tax=Acuticoccus sp. MNP-M23 TaxID=3072793 RepID=UPI00281698A6|nr:hypothetical protein [Acuticoccus sp. MNP-M23]WMS42291.1 hypothetical protein RDV64_19845 [Acuticoccus sp. MNP-M23]